MTLRWPRAYVDAEGFKEARLIAGWDRKTAAGALAVTTRTIRNWEAGRVCVPYSAFKLMRILSGYALPGSAWAGWCVRGDTLWSPAGQGFQVGSLSYLSLVFRMARQFQLEHGGHSTWRARRARASACPHCGAVSRRRAAAQRPAPALLDLKERAT
jgi:hypothetical protein